MLRNDDTNSACGPGNDDDLIGKTGVHLAAIFL
jgi:hypothetical protein